MPGRNIVRPSGKRGIDPVSGRRILSTGNPCICCEGGNEEYHCFRCNGLPTPPYPPNPTVPNFPVTIVAVISGSVFGYGCCQPFGRVLIEELEGFNGSWVCTQVPGIVCRYRSEIRTICRTTEFNSGGNCSGQISFGWPRTYRARLQVDVGPGFSDSTSSLSIQSSPAETNEGGLGPSFNYTNTHSGCLLNRSYTPNPGNMNPPGCGNFSAMGSVFLG